jgi:thiol:disulfide interchange protein DsbC
MTLTTKYARSRRRKKGVMKPPAMILSLLAGGLTMAAPSAAQQSSLYEVPQAYEQEAAGLRTELERSHPGTRFTEIRTTPVKGLFEIWMNGNVAYIFSHAPRYFLFGRLFDSRTMRDLTAPGLARRQPSPEFAPVNVEQLPREEAITTVHGSGERRLFVFCNPFCPYCNDLEVELKDLGNVTVYTFQIMSFQELAHSLGITGTPTLIWEDGSRTVGLIDRAEIEKRLNETAEGKKP